MFISKFAKFFKENNRKQVVIEPFRVDKLIKTTEALKDAPVKIFKDTINDVKSAVRILEEKQNYSEIESEVIEEDNK